MQIIRSEFEPFRKKYRKYQEILNNPDRYKLSELVEAKREGLYEVEVALDAIAKERSGGRLMMELYDAVISASLSGSDTGIKLQFSSPLDKLVGFAIKEIGIQIVRGRARCLFDLWKAAMQIRGYDSLIHRYFDLESSALSSDLDLIQTLSKWVDTKTGIERPV